MTSLEQLRHAAEALPDGAALTLSKAMLLEALGTLTATTTHTVATLAMLLHRSPSTIRAWLEGGHFPGAYKLPGKKRPGAWRIPQAAVDAFLAMRRAGRSMPRETAVRAVRDSASPQRQRRTSGSAVGGLGAWRGVRAQREHGAGT